MRTYTFDLDEKSYTIRFDYNAICDIEELSGIPISRLLNENSAGTFTMRYLLWGGLKWKNNGLTKAEAGRLIAKLVEAKQYKAVMQGLAECLQYALKELQGDEETEGE